MSYNFVGDVYDRSTPIEMTQVNPEPALPAKPIDGLQVPDTDDFSHISFHQAARDGKIDLIVQKLRKFGRHNARRLKAINKCDEHDITPLHYAIRYGHVDVVKLLVEYGAEIDKPGEDGALPLHYAARFRSSATRQLANRPSSQIDTTDGEVSSVVAPLAQAISNNSLIAGQNGLQVNDADESESLISYLVQRKADVNARDDYLMTPLHYAASKANLTAVKELLQFDGIKIDAVDTSGSTALHCAATDGAVEIVKTLLEAGADARAKDYDKMTPIHFACTDGSLDTVRTLFEHAEKSCELSTILEERNRDGETALHAAVEGGYIDIVQLCLEKGANVRSRRANLAHPLHIAAINGHVEIAKCLMEHHAKIEARNVNHETPLHKAAASNKPRMVDLLLEKGADIECLDKDNYTPLLVAAGEGHTNVVQLLLNRGANLKAKDTQDKTAIFLAAEENCIDTLREILKHSDAKVLVDECDLYENTPLHVAAKKGYALVTEALLSHDARIDARNEDENTPLHLAAENGKVRTVVELLRKDPSIINDEDEASNTALHLAATEGHLKCCKELLERGAEVDARNSTLWTPLDCAASKGHLKVASLLLEFDSPIDPTDKAKTTPLHLAAREGHPEVVSLLLSKGADITLTDHTGRNCLDLAIDNGRKEAARAIVNDENWMQAMRNKTWEQRRVTTPMRKLIIKLPEVAEIVFNRCIKESGVNSEDENYQITLYYEFLEDVYSDWLDNDGTASETSSLASFSMEDETPEDDMYQKLRGKSAMEEAVKQLEEKKSHPLMIMVKNQREQLLGHPLVTFLLHYKWQTFGRYIYYFKLSLYIIFLFFLTGYTVYSTDNAPNCNKTNAIVSNDLKDSVPYLLWIEVGRIVILALASWHILSELFQMFYQRRQYSIFENLLEWAVYVLAIIYVADEFDVPLVNRCSADKQTIGALSIFCAWMALVLFIRKFPRLGIYVVMFTSIMYTFTKFFLIFVLFLVAFALAFYTLLKNQQDAFQNPARSIVKTGVMMIGEFDFDNIFNDNSKDVPGVTWFIFIVFLIIMTLILMNLLIGLAVDDIKGVQDQAALERQAMLVDLAMDVEKALPRKFRKKLLPDKEVIRPNQYTGFKRYWYMPPVSAEDVKTALKPNKSSLERLNDRTEALQETVETMKSRLKTMQYNQEELHKMLGGIVKKLEAIVEGDDDDDDQLF